MSAQFELITPEPRIRRNLWQSLLIVLRPKHWVKNLFCFAGIVFSGQLFVMESILRSLWCFAAFCFAASATYIFNDIFDRQRDRYNPRTATRPIASGDLSLGMAVTTLALLSVVAIASSAWLAPGCLLIMACYFALNGLYSVRFKQTVIADVICIALGFVLRILYGVYAVNVPPTAWIVLCTFFLALFLGFAKRKAELARVGEGGSRARPVLQEYSSAYLDILLAMSATMSILCYALFTVSAQNNPTLIISIVPVVYCVMRYMLHVMINEAGESPENILLSDLNMWLGILAWALVYVAILYGDFHLFVESTK